MSTTTRYALCQECATAVTNCDYSAFHDSSDSLAFLTAFVENAGLIVGVGEDNPANGYWACDGCGYDQIGNGHIFEPLN